MKLLANLTLKTYWQQEEAIENLDARLIALDKNYPKIGNVENYRPIIIVSNVIKFI